jgi:hypothetical protein
MTDRQFNNRDVYSLACGSTGARLRAIGAFRRQRAPPHPVEEES